MFYSEILQYQFELMRTSLASFQTEMIQFSDKQMAWLPLVTLLSGPEAFWSSPGDTILWTAFISMKYAQIAQCAYCPHASAFRTLTLPSLHAPGIARLHQLLYSKKILLKCLTCHFPSTEETIVSGRLHAKVTCKSGSLDKYLLFIALYVSI